MAAQKEMVPVVEKRLASHSEVPPEQPKQENGLEIQVLYTTLRDTLSALRRAAELSLRLGASITLVVPQVVPYPYPLTSPPVLLEFNERRFRTIAKTALIETCVRIYLCRDRDELLERVLRPRSVVVLGSRKRWWPTRERLLARRLRRSGHEVIVTETE